MIHSLYSNKEIFLRELISNASDAADKLNFEAINNNKLFEDDTNLKIKIFFDKENKNITISDNGIGMSREEVINNLGTIAKSGTKEFIDKLKDSCLDVYIVDDLIHIEYLNTAIDIPVNRAVFYKTK